MSLAEYRDAVTAWNAVQTGDHAVLSPDEEQQIAAMLDAMSSTGTA